MPDGDPEFEPLQVVFQNAREIAVQTAVFRLEFGQIVEDEGFVEDGIELSTQDGRLVFDEPLAFALEPDFDVRVGGSRCNVFGLQVAAFDDGQAEGGFHF